MSLYKFIIAAFAIQLVVAQENCPGLRLSTGLGALLGDLPLSSTLPSLPSLPSIDTCGAPDLSLPPLPPLSSGDCLPTLTPLPCETASPSPPVPCLSKRALPRRRRCQQGPLQPGSPVAPLPSPPTLPSPCFSPPTLQPPYLSPPLLASPNFPPALLPPPIEPYPLLKPKGGCPRTGKNKPSSSLREELLLKKGLTLGIGPDCGPDVGLLPDAVSTFVADALATPLAGGLDDCGCS